MSGSVLLILFGSGIIIALGVIFRKQLVRVPLTYAVIFFLGVLAAIGSKAAANKIEDVKRKIPL